MNYGQPTPQHNSFQLFGSREQAMALKELIRKRFRPKYLYRPLIENTHVLSASTDRHRSINPSIISSSASGPSFIKDSFNHQCRIKPNILKKKSVLAKRLNMQEIDKLKKDIQKAKEQTICIDRKMRFINIPLSTNQWTPRQLWSKQTTSHSTTADSEFRRSVKNQCFFQ